MQSTLIFSESIPFKYYNHACDEKLGKFGKNSLPVEAIPIIRHELSVTYSGKGRLALTQWIHICLRSKAQVILP